MLCAYHVSRKGLVPAHGTAEMLQDLDRLRYDCVMLNCDNEPALVSVQKEAMRLRTMDTIIESSSAGESKPNGMTKRCENHACVHGR